MLSMIFIITFINYCRRPRAIWISLYYSVMVRSHYFLLFVVTKNCLISVPEHSVEQSSTQNHLAMSCKEHSGAFYFILV